ncbi:PilW family protein [Shewanella algidipiscicola]|uniref:Type IV minor pilin protein PilW n=1 Tax=Shewanella algidipiscicola TaxID=614070 RepID=A0ABQ4PJJ9_9GAMM|nr:PilW family protein [Shewanella algidipiscicola]GIU47919.1 type IV minor pilin protein PilW [Shewanella algidipiscicola]
MKNTSGRYYLQSGLSLVELMVALVISLFLTAGIFTMFSMSSTNVTTTSQFNQLQENGRIALAIMERDLSQLGFMGDMTGTDFIVGINTTINSAAVPNDCVGGGVNNASLPNSTASHFRRLWGYEAGGSGASFSCLTGVKNNTDVLQIKRLSGPSTLTANDASNHYVATTSSQSIFFTGNQTTPVLDNSRLWEYVHHIYFIKNDGSTPVLRRKTLSVTSGMKNEEQLVEGIENMRILYGVDDNGNGIPNRYVPPVSVDTTMWDNQSFQRIVALKVFLLVRAVEEDRSYTNETQYLLGDKTILAPKDHFRRKVMSTTVVLENPVLIRS